MKKIILTVIAAALLQGCIVVTRSQLRASQDPKDRAIAEELTSIAESYRKDLTRYR